MRHPPFARSCCTTPSAMYLWAALYVARHLSAEALVGARRAQALVEWLVAEGATSAKALG